MPLPKLDVNVMGGASPAMNRMDKPVSVTCPRCKGPQVLDLVRLANGDHESAPCPYCFATSKKPPQVRGALM